jgi:uncharacterized protein YbjT (DUF2867 family)
LRPKVGQAYGITWRSPLLVRIACRTVGRCCESGAGESDQGLGTPYTILRSIQFFEFVGRIADEGTDGNMVHVPDALIQPVVSDDVVSVLAEIALAPPANSTLELGGPDCFRFEQFIARGLSAKSDKRTVVADQHARYFGTELREESLVAGSKARNRPDTFRSLAQTIDAGT